MALQCNINQRGRRARFNWGLLMLAVAAAFAVAAAAGWWASPWAWAAAAICLAFALFGFFEARKGWCVVRAMGIKTPI
ncbi:MAG: hypothetical protein WD294_13760 [Phycisphaeraceae bacterium]